MSPSTSDVLAQLLAPHRAKVYRLKRKASLAGLRLMMDAQLGRASIVNRHGIEAKGKTIDGKRVFTAFEYFEYESKPSFAAGLLKEVRYGFLLLVGCDKWLCAVYSGVSWRDSAMDGRGTLLEYANLRKFVGSSGRAYERMAVRNLSIGEGVLHSQTIEAVDLKGIYPTLGAGRQVVRNTRVRDGKQSLWTVSLGTGWLSESRGRSGLDDYRAWCMKLFSSLDAVRAWVGSSFMDSFATPWRLDELPSNVEPTALLLRLSELRDGVASGALHLAWRLPRQEPGERRMSDALALHLIDRLSQPLEVARDGKKELVRHPQWGEVAQLKALKGRYRAFGAVARLAVEDDASGDLRGLGPWLSEHHAVQVVYSDVRFAYVDGQLFSDVGLATQIPVIKRAVIQRASLSNLDSEKGDATKRKLKTELQPKDTRFPDTSVFRQIEDDIAKDDDYLVCDDSTDDEWADYIGVRADPPRISLYHGKWSGSSTSASTFHDLVGQGLKNLARILVSEVEMSDKKAFWAKRWNVVAKPKTRIARIRRAPGATRMSAPEVVAKIAEVVARSDAKRRVVLVHAGMSRRKVLDQLAEAEAALTSVSPTARPHVKSNVAQLVWLLGGFVSACRELGAEGVVYCRR